MQFFSSILLEEGKNGIIEGKKRKLSLFPGIPHPAAGIGERNMGEAAERRGTMELYEAQRDMLGVHDSKTISVARLHQQLIVSALYGTTFI